MFVCIESCRELLPFLCFVCYDYGRIIAEYSPTGKEDFFGHFEFEMESSNDYTSDMLEAVAMEVYVLGDEIVKVDGYDV